MIRRTLIVFGIAMALTLSVLAQTLPSPDLVVKTNRPGSVYDAGQTTKAFAEDWWAVYCRLISAACSVNAYDYWTNGFNSIEHDGDFVLPAGGSITAGAVPVFSTVSGWTDLRAQTIRALGSFGADVVPLIFTFGTAPLSVTNGGLYKDFTGDLYWGKGGSWEKLNAQTVLAPYTFTGSTDAVQLKVVGHSTQTENIFEVKDSFLANMFTVSGAGAIEAASTITGTQFLSGATSLGSTSLSVGSGGSVTNSTADYLLSSAGLNVADANRFGFTDVNFRRSGTELIELFDQTTGSARLELNNGSAASPALEINHVGGNAGLYNSAGFLELSVGGLQQMFIDTTKTAVVNDFQVGGTPASSARAAVNGTADEVQLLVEGHSTQTGAIVNVANSAGTDLVYLAPGGLARLSLAPSLGASGIGLQVDNTVLSVTNANYGAAASILTGGFRLGTSTASLGLFDSAGVHLTNAGVVSWSDSANRYTGTDDVSFERVSAGIVGVTDGSTGTGDLQIEKSVLTSSTMTVNKPAVIRSAVSSYSWTNAMVVALGAALTGDVQVCTLPAKTVVLRAWMVVDSQAAGTTTLTGSIGKTGADYVDYILARNLQQPANTVYGVDADLGLLLDGTTSRTDLPSYTATTNVFMHFIATGANLDQVTTSTGTVFLETMTLP